MCLARTVFYVGMLFWKVVTFFCRIFYFLDLLVNFSIMNWWSCPFSVSFTLPIVLMRNWSMAFCILICTGFSSWASSKGFLGSWNSSFKLVAWFRKRFWKPGVCWDSDFSSVFITTCASNSKTICLQLFPISLHHQWSK